MVKPHDGTITATSPDEAVREWFERLDKYCAAKDYKSAREIVAGDVISFGTKAELVSGLDTLQRNQWEEIWPYIEDFGFDQIYTHGEGDLGWGTAIWTSTGFNEDGNPFHRPGRATVVIQRVNDTWQAIHTHFSLFPGTPQRTFGPSGSR